MRALIERADAPERLRIEAIGGFEDSQRTTDEDAAYLRAVYTKIDNPRIKARIARVIGQLGGDAERPVAGRSHAQQRRAARGAHRGAVACGVDARCRSPTP